jgi:CRP-like cAMP-binding protein
MERVMFMRKVALFEELAPGDLKQIARLATERFYPPGAQIVRQGDPGDELYIIVSGNVRVMTNGQPVAVRSVGDTVGEMAILTREPRMATLVADGDVRVLCVEQRQFEVMLRDRPEIGLAVIKTLAQRLRERP